MADRALAFAAAVRMVARVHDRTADGRADALMTLAAGLAELLVGMVEIADLADGGHAVDRNIAELAARKTDQRVLALLGHQLRHVAGAADQLSALAGIKLNIVDKGADGDVGKRQRVAGLDIGAGAAHHHVADLEAFGGENVSLFAVFILNQCDESRAVGVVLKGEDGGRHIQLVAPEIDDTVFAAVAAALMTYRNAAGVVAAAVLFKRLQQALFRGDLGKPGIVNGGHAATASGGRLKFLNSHCCFLSFCCFAERLCAPYLPNRQFIDSKNWIPLESGLRVTTAFFHEAV